MGRAIWSQLRFRPARALALLAGMFVAAAAFTVLTAAAGTSQLRTVGTVRAHFRSAYDILVRPRGAQTALEVRSGTVQPDFLSGIYGGITMAQWRRIEQIPGVDVAAPIAMVGYTQLLAFSPVRLPAVAVARPGRQLYRVTATWVSQHGTTRVTPPPTYVYVTPRPLSASADGATEALPDGSLVKVCNDITLPGEITDPFGLLASSKDNMCWSRVNGLGSGPLGETEFGLTAEHPGQVITWSLPVLVAAIDPAAEARLDGLSHALTSGSYLQEGASPELDQGNGDALVPVLAAAGSGTDESLLVQVQQLAAPSGPVYLGVPFMRSAASYSGPVIETVRIPAQAPYQQLLQTMAPDSPSRDQISQYWTVGPVRYRQGPAGTLAPVPVRNPVSVWRTGQFPVAAEDNQDTQYRVITDHAPASADSPAYTPVPVLQGTFDPAKIRPFDPLTQVPLGPYTPVSATPADPASRRALGGHDLEPDQNLGGFVTQPVDLITSLGSLPVLEDSTQYGTGLPAADPISAIRVRVAGVTGPDAVSLERIRLAAQRIALSTGLTVDIVAGSSPTSLTVALPASKFGRPPLLLAMDWVRKGVAVAILSAADRKSVALFTLILVVCALFVANSATASVRGRRRELGVLACLGWPRARLFGVVLGELLLTGLAAGALGAAAALPLSRAFGLHASAGRALLAVPAAVAVALAAGLIPAWLAARATPVAAVRPPVAAAVVARSRRPARGITWLAVANVLRTPGRTATGIVSLAVGVAGLTVLAAITFAFRGVVVGSLLGDAVALQVRGVDYVAVAATVALGVLAVADVVYLNISERASELAVLRSFGWPEATLARLIVTEGTLIGLVGSLAGAGGGLAAAALIAGQLPAALFVSAVLAAATGVIITAIAAVVPAALARRLPVPQLLAEE